MGICTSVHPDGMIINRTSKTMKFDVGDQYLDVKPGFRQPYYCIDSVVKILVNGERWKPYSITFDGKFDLDTSTRVTIYKDPTCGYVLFVEDR